MLKLYRMNGRTFQFEEKDAPAGAVLIEKRTPAPAVTEKKATPKNKAVTPRNKAVKAK